MLSKTMTTGPERTIIENMLDLNRQALIDTARGLSAVMPVDESLHSSGADRAPRRNLIVLTDQSCGVSDIEVTAPYEIVMGPALSRTSHRPAISPTTYVVPYPQSIPHQ